MDKRRTRRPQRATESSILSRASCTRRATQPRAICLLSADEAARHGACCSHQTSTFDVFISLTVFGSPPTVSTSWSLNTVRASNGALRRGALFSGAPCSAGRGPCTLTPVLYGFVWCSVILPDKSLSNCAGTEVSVRVEVVTVALRKGKSASDDLMERLSNRTLNRKSADLCEVRHMCF